MDVLVFDSWHNQHPEHTQLQKICFRHIWLQACLCITTKRHGLLQDLASQQAGIVEGDDLLILPGLITFPGSFKPNNLWRLVGQGILILYMGPPNQPVRLFVIHLFQASLANFCEFGTKGQAWKVVVIFWLRRAACQGALQPLLEEEEEEEEEQEQLQLWVAHVAMAGRVQLAASYVKISNEVEVFKLIAGIWCFVSCVSSESPFDWICVKKCFQVWLIWLMPCIEDTPIFQNHQPKHQTKPPMKQSCMSLYIGY